MFIDLPQDYASGGGTRRAPPKRGANLPASEGAARSPLNSVSTSGNRRRRPSETTPVRSYSFLAFFFAAFFFGAAFLVAFLAAALVVLRVFFIKVSSLQVPHHIDEAPYGRDRLVEHRPFGRVQLDLDHLLHAAGSEDDRYTDVEILHPVLALQMGGAGKHTFFVQEKRLGHLDCRGGQIGRASCRERV